MILLSKTNLDGPLKGLDHNVYKKKNIECFELFPRKKLKMFFKKKGSRNSLHLHVINPRP